jgi:hypothetical protein
MTDAQKFHFYFPAWTACVKANGWRKVKGRLDLNSQPSTLNSPELTKVMTFAEQRAAMARRGLEIDDLRHGAHWLALGKDKSSQDLTNAEVDRVVTLFKLLANPLDLNARLAWDAYERGEDPGAVKRVEYFIRRCPDAYVRAVSADKFGTRAWENLTVKQKGLLSMTLSNRPLRAANKPKPQPQPVPAGNEDPDWNVD